MKKSLYLVIVLFFVTACVKTGNNIKPSVTRPISDTPSPTLSLAPTSSRTPSPSATPTPLATATVSYPLTKETPLSISGEKIQSQTVDSLRVLVDWWQNPAGVKKYSPDGSLIFYATTSWIKVYDSRTLKEIKQINTWISPGASENDMQISNDHQRIMLVQGQKVKVITFTGEELFSAPLGGSAAMTPDGKKLALVKQCTFMYGPVLQNCETDIYDIDTQKMEYGFPGEKPVISPDGNLVATFQGNFLAFRRISDGVKIREFTPDDYLHLLWYWEFSPDSSTVVIVHEHQVDIINLTDGKKIRTIVQDGEMAKISPNNSFVGIKIGSDIKSFNLGSGELLATTKLVGNFYSFKIDNSGGIIQQTNFPLFEEGMSIQNIGDLTSFQASDLFGFVTREDFCTLTLQTKAECQVKENRYRANDGNLYDVVIENDSLILYREINGLRERITLINWKAIAFSNVTGIKLIGYSPQRNFMILQINIGVNTSKVMIVDLQKGLFVNPWDWELSRMNYYGSSQNGVFAGFSITGRNEGEQEGYIEGVFDYDKGWFIWRGGNPDSQMIVFAPDNTTMVDLQIRNGVSLVYVYDFIRRELKGFYEMQAPYGNSEFGRCDIKAAAITSDSQSIFFGCADGSIVASSLETGTILARWKEFNESVSAMAISRDGSLLAVGNSSGFIRILGVKN